ASEGCDFEAPGSKFACYDSGDHYPKTIALVGDSHMEALLWGFKRLKDENRLGMNVLAIGKSSCSPFIYTESMTPGGVSLGCEQVITAAIEEISASSDIEWVVLVGRHAARFEGNGFGAVEAHRDILDYRYSEAALRSNDNREIFSLGLKRTLDILNESGKRVIFVDQLPELGFHLRPCVDNLGFGYQEGCSLPLEVVSKRLGPYKKSVDGILSEYKNTLRYDPMKWVCGVNSCSPFDHAGGLFYRDDDHMSMYGAEVIAAEIARLIEDAVSKDQPQGA
ncbi:MAG: SGNH hydrolase domain-containing protein, partial [Pseudomonadales bacterium]